MTKHVGRGSPEGTPKTSIGKSSSEASQISSNGSLLNRAISSFLNFTWPVFGKMNFAEATFANYQEKNEIANKLAESLPNAGRVERTLLKNLNLKELQTLNKEPIRNLLSKTPREKLYGNILAIAKNSEKT